MLEERRPGNLTNEGDFRSWLRQAQSLPHPWDSCYVE